jgi:hypothetical protein
MDCRSLQAADITTHEQIEILFSNYTWVRGSEEMTVEEYNHVKHWVDPYTKASGTVQYSRPSSCYIFPPPSCSLSHLMYLMTMWN